MTQAMPQAITLASSVAEQCLRHIAETAERLTGSLGRAVALPGPRNPHLLAAHDAANSLNLQLRLLRGIWTARGGSVSSRRIPDLLRGAPGWERVQLDISGLPRTVLSPRRARVVMACILLALECVRESGSILLRRSEKGAIEIGLAGVGAVWPGELASLLLDPEGAWQAIEETGGTLAAHLVVLASGLNVPVTLHGPEAPAMSVLSIGRR